MVGVEWNGWDNDQAVGFDDGSTYVSGGYECRKLDVERVDERRRGRKGAARSQSGPAVDVVIVYLVNRQAGLRGGLKTEHSR